MPRRKQGPGGATYELDEETYRLAMSGLEKLQEEIGKKIEDMRHKRAKRQPYPGGSVGPVPQFNEANRAYVEESQHGPRGGGRLIPEEMGPNGEPIHEQPESGIKYYWGGPTRSSKVWMNDQECQYCHNKDGSLVITSDGGYRRRSRSTDLTKAATYKARQARLAKIRAKSADPAKTVPAISKNGAQFKRKPIAKEILQASAIRSHVARGIKPASALKQAEALEAHAKANGHATA